MTTVPITPQMVFDAGWQEYVLKDVPPSVEYTSLGSYPCRYLTPDGRRCPFGHVLPQNHAAMKEEATAGVLLYAYPYLFDLKAWDSIGEQTRFYAADRLQKALHDDLLDNKGQWQDDYQTQAQRRDHYLKVAEKYGLTV